MRLRKGQQSVELLLAFSAALAIFITFYALFAQQYGEGARREVQAEGVSIADGIASEIGEAARAGDGYSRRFTYPQDLFGVQNYSLIVNNVSGTVDLTIVFFANKEFNYSSPVITRAIQGEQRYATQNGFWMVDSTKEIPRGYAYAENRNGTVFITQMRVE